MEKLKWPMFGGPIIEYRSTKTPECPTFKGKPKPKKNTKKLKKQKT